MSVQNKIRRWTFIAKVVKDGKVRTFQPPAGISFEGEDPHRYLLFPGGSFPRIAVVLRNDKGARRSVAIDPVTAVPQITRLGDTPQ